MEPIRFGTDGWRGVIAREIRFFVGTLMVCLNAHQGRLPDVFWVFL